MRNTKIIRYSSSMLANSVGHAVGLFGQILFARFLGVEGYGLLALALAFVLLPSSLLDLGVTASTPRFIAFGLGEADYSKVRKVIRDSFFFQGGVAVAFTVLLFFISPYIAQWMSMPRLHRNLLGLCLFVPGVYLFNWTTSVLKGLGHNVLQVFLDSFFLQVFTVAVGVSAWFTFHASWAVVAAHGAAYLLTGLVGTLGLWRALRELPKTERKSVFSFKEVIIHGIPLNLTALAQRLFRRIDIIVVGAMLDAGSVGLYRVASSLAGGLKRLLTPLNDFAVFRMSKSMGMNRSEAALRHYTDIVLISLTISLPLYMILYLFGGELVVLLYKQEFAAATPLLRVLLVGFSVFIAVGPMGALFNALGKNWIRMGMVICMSMLNLILNIILIKIIGLIGCAYATSFSFIALFVIFHFYVKRSFLDMKIDSRQFVLIPIAFVLTYAVQYVSEGDLIMRVVFGVLGAAVVFVIGLNRIYKLGILRWSR